MTNESYSLPLPPVDKAVKSPIAGMVRYILLAVIAYIAVGQSQAFVPQSPSRSSVVLNGWLDKGPSPRSNRIRQQNQHLLTIFIAPAFANEKIDTPDRTASGLSGGPPKPSVEVTICGKKTKAIPGQRMRDLVTSARAPIKFDCGKCFR